MTTNDQVKNQVLMKAFLGDGLRVAPMAMINMNVWVFKSHKAIEACGLIPQLVNSPEDVRSAKLQIDDNYRHGGGWSNLKGWRIDKDTLTITYKEYADESYQPLAICILEGEVVIIYPSAWTLVADKDLNTFEVSRID